ncbi:pancreatic lipase-related protein 2-like [Liolophura sinensis]|uniref:pancreatic lipase-related protein 2-like n=1 Tax=Liolophura sinensis TaxID=3198878 RepID=UPI003159046D
MALSTAVYFTATFLNLGLIYALFSGKNNVCYDNLGCFDTSSPFDNAWKYLPQSPESVNVNFKLYTRNDPETGKVLNENDPDTVTTADFDAEKDIKFLIHGYVDHGNAPWVLNMSRMFLQKEDCNVVAVDWHEGAHTFYPQAVANTRLTAAVTAKLIKLLHTQFGLDLQSVHLIGHSLGSHIAGYIGHRTPGIGRITGLDPAGPLFEETDKAVRLDPSDAIFVDVIHSDGIPVIDLGFGTQQELGHLDFYPNGGTQQPGCPSHPYITGIKDVFTLHFKDVVHTVDCSHNRAIYLFTESIVNSCRFLGHPCSTKEKFDQGACANCGPTGCPPMGYPAKANQAPSGRYYLKTGPHEPFCQSV